MHKHMSTFHKSINTYYLVIFSHYSNKIMVVIKVMQLMAKITMNIIIINGISHECDFTT